MKLIDPKGNRNAIFEAAEQMTKLGVVSFPADTEGRTYILTINDDGEENKYDLSSEELLSLAQIELMKDEIISICKYDSSGTGGGITYNLPPEKRNTMHDDRAFTYGLLCFFLSQLRRNQIINKPQEKVENISFEFRTPKNILERR